MTDDEYQRRMSLRPCLRLASAVVAVALVMTAADPAAARLAPGHPAAGTARTAAPDVHYSDGRHRDARLTIPAVGVRRLLVVAYRGKTDDAPGTRIQNRGIAASPFGPRGGAGPGAIGNYQVTGHRTSHGGAFRRTPSLHRDARVLVDVGRWRYVYRIVGTRWAGQAGQEAAPRLHHDLDLRHARGPRPRQLLDGPVGQPRAPHRQDRPARTPHPQPRSPRRPLTPVTPRRSDPEARVRRRGGRPARRVAVARA
jgi:hypothetical protein